MFQVASPQFPDWTANYQQTVVEPAEAALEAQAAQEAEAQANARQTGSDNPYKAFIYWHESGNNPWAVNASSGACGLGQALPCSKMGCALGDYACQDAWFDRYAISSYGSWYNAYCFWLRHSWW